MKPSQLRNLATLFYFAGTFVLVAVIAFALTGTASAKAADQSTFISVCTFSCSTSSTTTSSSTTSTSGEPGHNGHKLGKRINPGGTVEFKCVIGDTVPTSITWYFGDGSSAKCLGTSALRHTYPIAGDYMAYALDNDGNKVFQIFVKVKEGIDSSFSLVGFILLALGASTHYTSRKLQIKA